MRRRFLKNILIFRLIYYLGIGSKCIFFCSNWSQALARSELILFLIVSLIFPGRWFSHTGYSLIANFLLAPVQLSFLQVASNPFQWPRANLTPDLIHTFLTSIAFYCALISKCALSQNLPT